MRVVVHLLLHTEMELRIVRHRDRDEIGGGKPGVSQKYLLPFNFLFPL